MDSLSAPGHHLEEQLHRPGGEGRIVDVHVDLFKPGARLQVGLQGVKKGLVGLAVTEVLSISVENGNAAQGDEEGDGSASRVCLLRECGVKPCPGRRE